MAAPDGLLLVDKPAGWTSHDVVGRCRRLAGTRKVGHAGTLDPMATGVLVVGVGRATRLLGHLSLTDKGYDATIRLGQSTVTDDAEGDVLAEVDASHLTRDAVEIAVAAFRGDILQVPSSVSAIKIKGERAYKRVRDGEQVDLPSRPVHVSRFDVLDIRVSGAFADVDVSVECSTGTYIRALARDLGSALGVGGHLTMLRRNRVGPYLISQARTLEALEQELAVVSLDEAAASNFAAYVIDDEHIPAVRNGRPLHARMHSEPEAEPAADASAADVPKVPVAVFSAEGQFLALYEQHGPVAQALAVFAPA